MLDDVRAALDCVQLCRILHDYKKTFCSWEACSDTWWQLVYEAFECIGDISWMDCNEYAMLQKYYFSSNAMMEYYRLCREYCHMYHVSLKENPFIKKAEKYADDMMEFPKGDFGYILQTRINHEWASGIVLYYSEYFDSYKDMIEALLEIFDFYERELAALKSALSPNEAVIKNKEAA